MSENQSLRSLTDNEQKIVAATTAGNIATIRPLSNRVIIKPEAAEEKTKSGIIIPDSAKEKPARGIVCAAGPGSTYDSGAFKPTEAERGDVVLYGKYAGTTITLEGDDYLIMRDSDLFAVIGHVEL